MKTKFLILAILLSTASLAYADGGYVRNDSNSLTLNVVNGQGGFAAVDQYGIVSIKVSDPTSGLSQSVIPVNSANTIGGVASGLVAWARLNGDTAETGSTTTVINATAHTASVGDAIMFESGAAAPSWSTVLSKTADTITLAKALKAAPANGNSFSIYNPVLTTATYPSTTVTPALQVAVSSSTQASAATGILKLEDAAAASGDAIVGIGGVVNTAGTALAAAGDYTTPALTTTGAMQVNLDINHVPSTATNFLKQEDGAAADTNTIGGIGFVREDALTVNTGSSGDWTWGKVDAVGRLITTMAPAGESFQSCGTATASTADVAIKAAVASNRMYVTNITCSSSDADNATNINFKDGSTVIAVGGVNQMATTSAGTFTATFPVPLRGTVNTALNFNTAVSTSSVICCASGYISVN